MSSKRKKKNTKISEKYKIELHNLSCDDFIWLIKWLFQKSKRYCLIDISQAEYNRGVYEFLEKMKPYLLSQNKVNEWPGTVYGGNERFNYAVQYCFKCNDASRKIFLKYIQSFNQLRAPNMLEDLCFYSNDGHVLFYSVIHEDMKYIVNLDKVEAELILNNIDKKNNFVSANT